MRQGRFREDLFFRLNVITLVLPALRERREDVLPLARHYLGFFARQQGRHQLTFSPRSEQAIASSCWPGNLRQLRNAVERAVILSPAQVIEPGDLGLEPASLTGAAGDVAVPREHVALGDDVSLELIEREHLARVVARAPSFEAAARTLGIDVTTLQRKRKRYGLA